jgi:hypothetical protein
MRERKKKNPTFEAYVSPLSRPRESRKNRENSETRAGREPRETPLGGNEALGGTLPIGDCKNYAKQNKNLHDKGLYVRAYLVYNLERKGFDEPGLFLVSGREVPDGLNMNLEVLYFASHRARNYHHSDINFLHLYAVILSFLSRVHQTDIFGSVSRYQTRADLLQSSEEKSKREQERPPLKARPRPVRRRIVARAPSYPLTQSRPADLSLCLSLAFSIVMTLLGLAFQFEAGTYRMRLQI